MPPPSNRMTKNRPQPARYRPGKAEAEDAESEEESDEEDDSPPVQAKAPPPKASSFPTKKLAVDLSRADHQTSIIPQSATLNANDELEGFVTASESSAEERDGSSGESSSEEGSDEEHSSSEEEPRKPMLAPKFITKAKRDAQATNPPLGKKSIDEERKRKEKADELLKAQLERDAVARAAGRKYWDDDDNIAPEDEVDDRDGLDPDAEKAAWKLRELKRVRRERLVIEEKEAERAEIERRRNMTAQEREEEDRKYIDGQKEEREGKGKMAYMQKYFHKGAFFSGDGEQDAEVQSVLNRDLTGARFEDEMGDKSVLPEYMRIRDMTRLGRKGRTKYLDLKNEDTGRWGADVGRKQRRDYDGLDERFRPDEHADGGRERTGANSAPIGERRRRNDEDTHMERHGKRPKFD